MLNTRLEENKQLILFLTQSFKEVLLVGGEFARASLGH
ncbi:hypothetical protein Meth11DRAFT_1468 [Methylophilaceae bacterium 11]|jgi:hypothetical protein|nr:hypothetical protein Meth11DRAFT_1468 [Methylophilaceae bacterium 11]